MAGQEPTSPTPSSRASPSPTSRTAGPAALHRPPGPAPPTPGDTDDRRRHARAHPRAAPEAPALVAECAASRTPPRTCSSPVVRDLRPLPQSRRSSRGLPQPVPRAGSSARAPPSSGSRTTPARCPTRRSCRASGAWASLPARFASVLGLSLLFALLLDAGVLYLQAFIGSASSCRTRCARRRRGAHVGLPLRPPSFRPAAQIADAACVAARPPVSRPQLLFSITEDIVCVGG